MLFNTGVSSKLRVLVVNDVVLRMFFGNELPIDCLESMWKSYLKDLFMEMRNLYLLCIVALTGLNSPLAEGQPSVVINEIMYHPASDETSDEFLELFNAGDSAVDLSGWEFTDGIEFFFPDGTVLEPGAYLVLSPDLLMFETVYGSSIPVTGPYTGALDNGGERLELMDGDGQIVDELEYSDDAPWPSWPDGEGPSLELIDPES